MKFLKSQDIVLVPTRKVIFDLPLTHFIMAFKNLVGPGGLFFFLSVDVCIVVKMIDSRAGMPDAMSQLHLFTSSMILSKLLNQLVAQFPFL